MSYVAQKNALILLFYPELLVLYGKVQMTGKKNFDGLTRDRFRKTNFCQNQYNSPYFRY